MSGRELRSWVGSANEPNIDFPLQNLPFGVFRADAQPSIGVAIGDQILDLRRCINEGLFTSLPAEAREACQAETLNSVMELEPVQRSVLRSALLALLSVGAPQAPHLLVPQNEVQMLLPAAIGDYTDFYASIDHATRVGKIFRPDQPLLPNYRYVPIGYHGRASSIVLSGTPIRRPSGQAKPSADGKPVFGPTRALDYELEAGLFIGPGNALGHPIPITEAESHIFGVCLVNDWSARDIQSWEYQPLGPFLSKSFATSISPWVVTLDALSPFRVPTGPRTPEEPAPLSYLSPALDGIDLTLDVFLSSHQMRHAGLAPALLSRSNLRGLYWTPSQLIAHHTSNGCNLRPGDLLATGTVSGPSDHERGCLLELTRRGAASITLPSGETRAFLEDGDEVTFHGYCERPGQQRIGFGVCRGMIVKGDTT